LINLKGENFLLQSNIKHAGSTSVVHDTEMSLDVGHCAEPGCYSKAINYNATSRQMAALAQLSNECHQSIKVTLALKCSE
jgi:hypothetical protein